MCTCLYHVQWLSARLLFVTCARACNICKWKILLTIIKHLLSTLQEVFLALQGHVTAIVVGTEMQVLLRWLHQSMFDLTQQCLLFPLDDVQVS
jgi:hypothetical protein